MCRTSLHRKSNRIEQETNQVVGRIGSTPVHDVFSRRRRWRDWEIGELKGLHDARQKVGETSESVVEKKIKGKWHQVSAEVIERTAVFAFCFSR